MRPEERARRPGESREVSGRADPLQHDAAQTAHRIRRQQEISFTFTGLPHFMISPLGQRITSSSYLAPVLTLNPAPHAGLCDVSGHPLHWQPAGPNGHRCQGPGRHQAGGSRHGRGERVFMNLPLVFPKWISFTKREGETLLTVCFSCILISMQQGSLQIYLKSKNGPIEVYLCPEEGLEDASPVKSTVTPKKEFQQPLGPPTTTSTVPPSCSVKEESAESTLGFPVG